MRFIYTCNIQADHAVIFVSCSCLHSPPAQRCEAVNSFDSCEAFSHSAHSHLPLSFHLTPVQQDLWPEISAWMKVLQSECHVERNPDHDGHVFKQQQASYSHKWSHFQYMWNKINLNWKKVYNFSKFSHFQHFLF